MPAEFNLVRSGRVITQSLDSLDGHTQRAQVEVDKRVHCHVDASRKLCLSWGGARSSNTSPLLYVRSDQAPLGAA